MVKRKIAFTGNARFALQALAIVVALALLAIPIIVVATSGSFSVSATYTSLRILALMAFTLIFISILTGSFRPFFNRIFKPASAQQIHVAIALAGFALALSHGSLVLVFGLAGYNAFIVSIGPTVLALLVLTMLIAFYRRRLKNSWRWIHRINYLIFGAVFAHGLMLGFDFKRGAFLKILFGIYAGIVVAGLIYRYMTLRSLKVAAANRANARAQAQVEQ